jgi:divalent metal cation (Fe/Co/Zn/Cd) transporter
MSDDQTASAGSEPACRPGSTPGRGTHETLSVFLRTMQSSHSNAMELASGSHPHHSPLGIALTAVTAVVMFALAAGKARTGRALGNPVLLTEGRVTTIDGLLAVAVLVGLVLNAVFGWWWADPLAALVLVYYALREAWHVFTETDERKVPPHQQNHV